MLPQQPINREPTAIVTPEQKQLDELNKRKDKIDITKIKPPIKG
jgi:hypothetical protein